MSDWSEQIRCDACGPLDWTVNAYGCITHKHACPHRSDDFCQAHPRGCDLGGDQRSLRRVAVELPEAVAT